ncbi:MAG: helix-turn-helix domain-containing protein [Candidatus Binatus sp.]
MNQNNFVRLTDADRVRDEPDDAAAGDLTGEVPGTFTLGAESREALASAQGSDAIVGHVSPRADVWAGLETEQTLGQLMTEARQHRGLSREQVADRTNIPAYYVRMIESDRYDAIPDQLYLLPFFRRYAIFLGLDAQKVVARFIRDFEKAENEVLDAPAPKATTAEVLLKWRRIAQAAVVAGILLPCIAWGIGTTRTALRHQVVDSPRVATSINTPRSPGIPPADARPATVAQVQARTPDAAATTAESSASPQIGEQLHAETKPPRRGRRHQLKRHSRHWRRGIS